MAAKNVTGIWNNTSDQFDEYYNYIYSDDQWYRVKPFIYTNGEWHPVGSAGALYVPFITSDNKNLKTSDGKTFLVPAHFP